MYIEHIPHTKLPQNLQPCTWSTGLPGDSSTQISSPNTLLQKYAVHNDSPVLHHTLSGPPGSNSLAMTETNDCIPPDLGPKHVCDG